MVKEYYVYNDQKDTKTEIIAIIMLSKQWYNAETLGHGFF